VGDAGEVVAVTMHEAAGAGCCEALRALLAAGADVNAAVDDGWTCLHSAVKGGHADAVRLLLDSGADPGSATTSGWTALHLSRVAHG